MAKAYHVKEIFYSLQGEGAHAGRPAIFVRFSGCNLWSGRDQDRSAATCSFCDTDFVGGTKYPDAAALVSDILALWPPESGVAPYVICTGGEPALQLDQAMVEHLHQRGCLVAVESNGTLPLPHGLDWVCISPKAKAPLAITSGDELKLVWPQDGILPDDMLCLDFKHFFLQPMDGPQASQSLAQCIQYCLSHPAWRLSLQTHKITGIP